MRPSALELDLKRIIRAHPEATLHPNGPSGPYVRAVLWTAGDENQILGQALWSTDHNCWVVRAYDTEIGDETLVVKNPASMSEIHDAITDVLDQVQTPALARPAVSEDPVRCVCAAAAHRVRNLYGHLEGHDVWLTRVHEPTSSRRGTLRLPTGDDPGFLCVESVSRTVRVHVDEVLTLITHEDHEAQAMARYGR